MVERPGVPRRRKGQNFFSLHSCILVTLRCFFFKPRADDYTTKQTRLKLSSVQLLSWVQFFVTPWIAACQASLSVTNSWSLLKLMSIESVVPSNHLLSPSPAFNLPSIRVFQMSQFFLSSGQSIEFQLQHQSFQ